MLSALLSFITFFPVAVVENAAEEEENSCKKQLPGSSLVVKT